MEESLIKIAVQVMGKVRTVIEISPNAKETEVITMSKADPQMSKWLEGKEIIKTIYVVGKVVNFIVKG
jgi:leucyl-tRNA synthetase